MGPLAENLETDAPWQPQWSRATRVAFRFCFVYFGLYCLGTQIITTPVSLPTWEVPDPATFPPMRQIVFWVAAHLFHRPLPLVYDGSGSGDKTWDWTLLFCLAVFSLAATAVWSWLDRRRENYVTLLKWFRLFIRLCLAGQMFTYGMVKLIPLQMNYPPLWRLLEPFGTFSPMGVLWSSIGAATAYEMFAGSAELLGGILLIIPRTALLGALVVVADMTQVFMLNMTYDVPVKGLSFHLLLMALFLAAPELRRLSGFFFSDSSVPPSSQPPLFKTRKANRIAAAAQVAFGVYLLAINLYGDSVGWKTYGGGAPKSVLYGIWDVNVMTIDGQVRAPLLGDYDRWRRIVFDQPDYAMVERIDDSRAGFPAEVDADKKTIRFTRKTAPEMKASFRFERTSPDTMTLDGDVNGHATQMELKRMDEKTLRLLQKRFHWVQEYPLSQ